MSNTIKISATSANKSREGHQMTLSNANGSRTTWFDGNNTLSFAGTAKTLTLRDEIAKQVRGILEATISPQGARKSGVQMTAQDREHNWELVNVVGDAHGVYGRVIHNGAGGGTVQFSREDLI